MREVRESIEGEAEDCGRGAVEAFGKGHRICVHLYGTDIEAMEVFVLLDADIGVAFYSYHDLTIEM